MADPIMLDSGPLGRIAHAQRKPDVDVWLKELLNSGATLMVPEVADYEIRRDLLLAGLMASVAVLDSLRTLLAFRPITSAAMLRAAELWADARRRGVPTAHRFSLDADVILAAQALEAGAIVATDNVKHISRYVTVRHWRLIRPGPPP